MLPLTPSTTVHCSWEPHTVDLDHTTILHVDYDVLAHAASESPTDNGYASDDVGTAAPPHPPRTRAETASDSARTRSATRKLSKNASKDAVNREKRRKRRAASDSNKERVLGGWPVKLHAIYRASAAHVFHVERYSFSEGETSSTGWIGSRTKWYSMAALEAMPTEDLLGAKGRFTSVNWGGRCVPYTV